MRAVVQRVKEAWVRVAEEEVARIGDGLLVLAGVAADDGPGDVAYLAQKLAHLRVFAGDGAPPAPLPAGYRLRGAAGLPIHHPGGLPQGPPPLL